ncbi:hypothetical protein HBI56_133520 [Parastagonospora nodorum]|nr:hypothetical protein HBH53_047270 [Parastagonospora nodorum]KAH3980271.1 hypothetical protein HBH52_094430 [Parastagonospora nodorum]KAH4039665.1 hypothetical protein HBI09_034880 [Parastagonospora nodorum]KAH4126217.1 hypothetical protein HBH47_057480 [Parastagonospora nodorum]KAH4609988.1 hypothetical protein HBH82_057760 [Parastagonospora nodorum]
MASSFKAQIDNSVYSQISYTNSQNQNCSVFPFPSSSCKPYASGCIRRTSPACSTRTCTHVARILRKKCDPCGSVREFLRMWIPEPCSRSCRICFVLLDICTVAYVFRFRV